VKLVKFISFAEKKQLICPSTSKIPQWWKDGDLDIQGEPGMKSCIPFMEVMNSGYTVNAPFDIFIAKSEEGNISIKWNAPNDDRWPQFIQERPTELGFKIPRPAGHAPNHFVWASLWGWKTPKGYSTLVTHPFNRFDLPFTSLSGIVDSDDFNGNGNVPFFIKENFQGVIPEGTPLFQLFPYKRDKWKSWVDDSTRDDIQYKQLNELRQPGMSYKKIFWKKKVYE
jgi:hypothetical protein